MSKAKRGLRSLTLPELEQHPLGDLVAVDSCPICGAPERAYAFDSHDWIYGLPGDFSLFECARCRCLYPDPRPAPQSLGAYYPPGAYYSYRVPAPYGLFARRGVAARAWYQVKRGVLGGEFGYTNLGGSAVLGATIGRLPRIHERATFALGDLLHPFKPSGAVLDVGCGTGTYLDLMRALGWERVVGVDISVVAVATAREALGIEAYVGELSTAGFPDGTFEAVTLSHTLEHVADPVALLAEVRRVTKPGGRIAVLVPNARSFVSRLLRDRWVGLDTPRHLVNFSPLALHTALVKAGLSIQSLETSPRGSFGVALFSTSRAFGDGREVYTDDRHRFPLERRALAASLSAIERALCAAGFAAGETLYAVAKP